MNKKLQFKSLILLVALLLGGVSSAWGDKISFDLSKGYSNAEAVSSVSSGVVTVTFAKGTNNSNEPKWYSGGTALRFYSGNTITFASTGAKIEKVVLTNTQDNLVGGTDGANYPTGGTYSVSNGVETWTPSAPLESFTVNITNKPRLSKIEVYLVEATNLENSDLALTGAPVALTFDLYNKADAQVVSYTTSSTGAITIEPATSEFFTYTHNAEAKTITVTPVAVTTSAQTVTINQAADNTYKSGSVTFTVSIDDTTPFDGAIFNAIKDKDTNNTSQGDGSITKDKVKFACTSGILGNGEEYRMYKNSTTTISTTDGSFITKIEFVGVSGYAASNFTEQTGWTASGNDGVWEGKAESVSFVASGAQVRATVIKVTVVENTNPSITTSNVNIAFDATRGSIAYTINNPVSAGELSASVPAGSWLTLGTVGETVPFTCEANPTKNARTATVTLTYTYGSEESVTKDVTVTQAGNPNIIDNISDITEIGTAYTVRGTVVATNSRGFIIGDGTGYVYYYKNAAFTQAVGDMVTISGTTGTYGQIIQFTKSATVAEATESNYDNTPAAEVITAVPDYSEGYHLSTYLEFEGAVSTSNSNYFITLGEKQIQISYPTTAQVTALSALVGKTAHVKGYFSGINSSSKFSVMLESVGEVVTIPESKYTTFASTANIDFNGTGVTAYTAEVNGNAAKLSAISGNIVPANTGVILYAETAGNYVGTITEGDPTGAPVSVDGNELVGVTTETDVPWTADGKYNYILQGGEFKKATGAKLHAGKAYLSTDYQATSRELQIVFEGEDEATGIADVRNQKEEGGFFNLSGQRVTKPTKGLYIKNGKKMIVK